MEIYSINHTTKADNREARGRFLCFQEGKIQKDYLFCCLPVDTKVGRDFRHTATCNAYSCSVTIIGRDYRHITTRDANSSNVDPNTKSGRAFRHTASHNAHSSVGPNTDPQCKTQKRLPHQR